MKLRLNIKSGSMNAVKVLYLYFLGHRSFNLMRDEAVRGIEACDMRQIYYVYYLMFTT